MLTAACVAAGDTRGFRSFYFFSKKYVKQQLFSPGWPVCVSPGWAAAPDGTGAPPLNKPVCWTPKR